MGSFACKNGCCVGISFVAEVFCIDALYWYLVSGLKVLQENWFFVVTQCWKFLDW